MRVRSPKLTIILGSIICTFGALFYCYEYMLRIEPTVMVPELMHAFGITASTLGFITAFYYYAYTPMQLLVGIIIDSIGTRVVITLALIFCTLGSFIFSNAHSIYLLGAGRFIIGFGSAFAFVAVLKLAAVWLPKHYFALFAGLATSLGMVGAMVGVVGLTAVVHQIGWVHALHIGTIVGLILIPLVWFIVRDAPKHFMNRKKPLSPNFKDTFFGLLQIVKNPQMWLSGIIGCMFYLSLSVVAELWGIPFLRTVYKLSPHTAAFACSLVFLGWLVGGPINGWFSDKIKSRRWPIIYCGVLAAATFALIVYGAVFISINILCILLFLFGVFCSAQVLTFAISRENNPTHVAATAVSFNNLIVMFGGVVLQPLIGVLLDLGWNGSVVGKVRIYTAATYQHAFLLIPVCILSVSFFALLLHEPYHKDIVDEFE